jgi:hypothetical protein
MDSNQPPVTRPSGSQLGTAAEVYVAAQLMLASQGRFSCYTPLVDGDAVDVLVLDRVTCRTLGLQVKSWTFRDETRPRTVQFDVQTATWRSDRRLFLLAVALDGLSYGIEALWLAPSAEIPGIASRSRKKMCLRPNPRPNSGDRFARYRRPDLAAVARELISFIEQ